MTTAHATKPTAPEATPELVAKLESLAAKVRQGSLIAIYHAKSGHPGGSLSSAELFATLYGAEMNVSPETVDDPHRDRFVLSKGHGAPALYAVGAERGFLKAEQIKTLRKFGSPLQGHPHVHDLPWVETSTGSLGQGISAAIGMALGLRYQKSPARVYAMLGDGELQEGQVWEAAMSGSHNKLDNLCAVIDYNKMQSDDLNENICGLEPLADKWRAFGWHTLEIDGHIVPEFLAALKEAGETKGKPTMIIAHTVKGQGVSYMAGKPLWHGSVTLSREETATALGELGMSPSEIEEAL